MLWSLSHRADRRAKRLADRHYNRQKPESPQFVPPGSCRVFLTVCGRALWVTSAPMAEYVRHEWAGAWVNSCFRNEGVAGVRASDLILQAIAATLALYGQPPALGMVTFVDPKHVPPTMVRGKPIHGFCYLKAGFEHVGFTKGGLWAWQLRPDRMPPPAAPIGAAYNLFAA